MCQNVVKSYDTRIALMIQDTLKIALKIFM